jgi:hypothetical protein
VEPFTIPTWWLRLLAVDWGKRAYTYGVWGALSPNDRLYIYREYAQKNKRVIEWASEIGQMAQGESYRRIVLCRSAWQDRGEDETIIAEKFKKYSGLEASQAKNDRIQGKLTFEEYLRWVPKPPSTLPKSDFDSDEAARIMRQHGIAAYKEYIKSFEPEEPESNLPKLQIFKGRAPVLVETIPLCIYGKSNTVGKPSEDVQEFEGDDPYDGTRYLMMEADDLVGEMRVAGEEHSRVGAAVESLQKTGDMTAYYRNMEAIERKNKAAQSPKPVSKYHRGRFR